MKLKSDIFNIHVKNPEIWGLKKMLSDVSINWISTKVSHFYFSVIYQALLSLTHRPQFVHDTNCLLNGHSVKSWIISILLNLGDLAWTGALHLTGCLKLFASHEIARYDQHNLQSSPAESTSPRLITEVKQKFAVYIYLDG